jgi:hypothetical protein
VSEEDVPLAANNKTNNMYEDIEQSILYIDCT